MILNREGTKFAKVKEERRKKKRIFALFARFAVKGLMRILAVDHGEKRIGLALSDPTATIASPFKVIEHVSRLLDAAQVANLASENEVGLIVVGQSFDDEGQPNLAGRRAAKFADALKEQTQIPVELFDESFSTQDARAAVIEMGLSRKKRAGHHDALAAVAILRSYIESRT